MDEDYYVIRIPRFIGYRTIAVNVAVVAYGLLALTAPVTWGVGLDSAGGLAVAVVAALNLMLRGATTTPVGRNASVAVNVDAEAGVRGTAGIPLAPDDSGLVRLAVWRPEAPSVEAPEMTVDNGLAMWRPEAPSVETPEMTVGRALRGDREALLPGEWASPLIRDGWLQEIVLEGEDELCHNDHYANDPCEVPRESFAIAISHGRVLHVAVLSFMLPLLVLGATVLVTV